jgi:hypothetical protein
MASSNLRRAIEALAGELAEGVLRALRGATLADLMGDGGAVAISRAPASASSAAPKRRVRGKRVRRSSSDLEGAVGKIVSTLRVAGAKGLRAEVLRKRVGLGRRAMMRPVALALSSKRIRKTGEKRATTYFLR